MHRELSKSQLKKLEADLNRLRLSLQSLLTATESGSKPVKLKDNAGRLSRMDEMHNQSILLANRNITKNRLRQVIAAIARMAADNYGDCASCDELIPIERLKAYPEATMCINCKSISEQSSSG